MGVEAPLALLALAFAGAPIAIHLIRQRDLPIVKLPTVMLLQAAQIESRRRVRVVDVLLLMLRVLALLLLLACLSRPYSLASVSASAEDAVALAIVLDDSASMGAARGRATVFDEARTRALAAMDDLPAGSEVTVVLAGTPSAVLVPATADLGFARTILLDTLATGTRADLPAALQLARRELARADSKDPRLLLLSDFRAGDLPEGGLPTLRGVLRDDVRIDPDPLPNVALRDVLVTPAPDDPAQLIVQLTAVRTPTEARETSDALPAVALHARIVRGDDTLLGETTFTLDGTSATARLTVPRDPTHLDPVRVSIQQEDDALPADNVRVIDLNGRARARVGLVNGEPHPSPHLDELTFLRAALDAADDGSAGSSAVEIDLAALEGDALGTLDVVVLANVSALNARQGARLEAFVERGGGLLITGGDQVQPAAYAAALPRCLPARMEPAASAPPGPLAGDSPFLSVNQPGVQRRLVLPALEHRAVALLRFADGSPVLAGRTLGAGRCALLATSVDLDWGDLALSAEFVGVVELSLDWLLGARRPTDAPRAGEPVTLPRPSTNTELTVVTPSGATLDVPPDGRFTETRVAGHYVVSVGGDASRRLSFVVEAETAESDLRAAPALDGREGDASEAVTRARRRSWVPMLLLFAALAILAEGIVRLRFPLAGDETGGRSRQRDASRAA